MAGIRPFFLTGANAKITVNNHTIAYCTNVSYSVIVNHATPRVLGMYEPSSVEPISYVVNGTFSVIRYVGGSSDNIQGTLPNGTKQTGNGVGAWGKDSIISGTDGRANESLNPSKLDKSTGFDIVISQKLPDGKTQSVAKIRDARITAANFNLAKNTAATQSFQFTALYADEDSFLADFSGLGQQFT